MHVRAYAYDMRAMTITRVDASRCIAKLRHLVNDNASAENADDASIASQGVDGMKKPAKMCGSLRRKDLRVTQTKRSTSSETRC